jgi:hypothetical protein
MSQGLGGDPYASPQPSRGAASAMVNGPATALIVVGAINALLAVYNVFQGLFGVAAPPPNVEGADPELVNMIQSLTGTYALVSGIVVGIVAVVIILGALKMKNLQSYGLSMASSILAMIPCISCCLIGLPIGIWSVVVLSKPEVKSAFH